MKVHARTVAFYLRFKIQFAGLRHGSLINGLLVNGQESQSRTPLTQKGTTVKTLHSDLNAETLDHHLKPKEPRPHCNPMLQLQHPTAHYVAPERLIDITHVIACLHDS